jgi:hypothetical protein
VPVTAEPVKAEELPAAETPVADAATSQIQYESGMSPISRRQFRLLFLLTVLNSLMLFLFVAGPVISNTLGGWKKDYKQWQADRLAAQQKAQAQQKAAADFQAALVYTAPANQTVYEEDNGRAATLIAGDSNYSTVRCNNFIYITPAPWQLPAIRKSIGNPAPFLATTPFMTTSSAIVFLHSRKNAAGAERLVHVEFSANEDLSIIRQSPEKMIRVRNQRALIANSVHAKPDATLAFGTSRSLLISQPYEKCTNIIWLPAKDGRMETGKVQTEASNVFRLFAGQADPKDASHFTITYELDDQPGIIDGWLLNDETVALEPRRGRTLLDDPTGRERHWDPYATPTTRPLGPPMLPALPIK